MLCAGARLDPARAALRRMAVADKAITYAALILADDEQEVTPEKLKTIVEAAGLGGKVESYWYSMFAKVIAAQGVEKLICTIGGGGGGGGGGGPSGGPGDAGGEEEEEKKESSSEEEVDMGGFGGDDY